MRKKYSEIRTMPLLRDIQFYWPLTTGLLDTYRVSDLNSILSASKRREQQDSLHIKKTYKHF